MAGRQSWNIFLTLLIVSILLHGFVWKWLALRAGQETKKAADLNSTTTTFVLHYISPPPPDVLIPEQPIEEHAPINNAEHFASSNTTDKSVTKLTALKKQRADGIMESETKNVELEPKPAHDKKRISSIQPTQTTHIKESLPAVKIDKTLSEGSLSAEPSLEHTEPKIANDLLVQLGNMTLLDDHHLGEVEVKEPFSEIEAKRIRMVNRYLERMEKQIKAEWMKPDINDKQFAGVIKFSLNPYGYLRDAYIYLGSGDSALDHSALEAVKRVNKFLVPESEMLAARYYSNLRFQYSSQDFVGESIPIIE